MMRLFQRCINYTKPRLPCNRTRPVTPHLYILSKTVHTIYEEHRKGHYRDVVRKRRLKDHYRLTGLLWPHMEKLKQEVAEHFMSDGYYIYQHNDFEYFWKFSDPTTYDKWVVTSDSDLNEGHSEAELCPTKFGHAHFRGHLSTKLIDDGTIKRTGYCNIQSPIQRLAFQRHKPYDWTRYTHLVVRVRGDGRTYHLIVALDRQFDVNWNDQYSYMLFTRGGPYWQTAKIPLSKFYHTHKGRLQDVQEPLMHYRHQVRSLGITIADDCDGDFDLELDYVALTRDENHAEEFAYELYDARTTEINM